MHLTRFTDYSFRTLIYLGVHGDALASIAEIATAYEVSEHHMTKVVLNLGRAGFVQTVRGRSGGLRLAMAPSQIRLGDVVRQTEEELAVVECLSTGQCPIRGPCRLEHVLNEATEAFLAVLDRYTLADLVGKTGPGLARRLGLPPPGKVGALVA
jgi:Rrf2 family nitric oxide-sensitive transcriptional repressor